MLSLSAHDKSILCIALALSIVSHVNNAADGHGAGPIIDRDVARLDRCDTSSAMETVNATAIQHCISSSRTQLLSMIGTADYQSRPSEFYASTLINMLFLLDTSTSIVRCSDDSIQMISDSLFKHLLTLPHGQQQHILSYMTDLLVERSVVLLDSGVSPYSFRCKMKSFYDSAFETMKTTMKDRVDHYLPLLYDVLNVLVQAVQRLALTYSDAFELLRHCSVYEHMGFLLRLFKNKCTLLHAMIGCSSARDAQDTAVHQVGASSLSGRGSYHDQGGPSTEALITFNDWMSTVLGNERYGLIASIQ